MNSFRQNKQTRKLSIVTLVTLAIFVTDVASGGVLRGFIHTVGAGAESVIALFMQSDFFASRNALKSENQSLKREIARLNTLIVEDSALRAENRALRDIVRLADRSVGIAAPVITSARRSPYGTFLIGAGAVDGVRVGDLVLAGASPGVVVGEVTQIDAHRALVQQIFAPNISTEVLVSGVPLFLSGRGGGSARADAPRDAPISVGDIVIAPSFGGRPIGVVAAVEKNVTGASQTVHITLPVNMAATLFVYVSNK